MDGRWLAVRMLRFNRSPWASAIHLAFDAYQAALSYIDQLKGAADVQPDSELVQPSAWHDGVLYCYGGCGTRYSDFPCDMLLPTPLWNRIAVGAPFDETYDASQEGRGGVLCPSCIARRLSDLHECTAIFADIEDFRNGIGPKAPKAAASATSEAGHQARCIGEASAQSAQRANGSSADPEATQPASLRRDCYNCGDGPPSSRMRLVLCGRCSQLYEFVDGRMTARKSPAAREAGCANADAWHPDGENQNA